MAVAVAVTEAVGVTMAVTVAAAVAVTRPCVGFDAVDPSVCAAQWLTLQKAKKSRPRGASPMADSHGNPYAGHLGVKVSIARPDAGIISIASVRMTRMMLSEMRV